MIETDDTFFSRSDKLFNGENDWDNCLHFIQTSDWRLYYYAYAQATELLINEAPRRPSYYTYPIMSLFRHTVELGIKSSIKLLCEKYAVEFPRITGRNGHDIEFLWKEFKEILNLTSHKETADLIEVDILRIAMELKEIDPCAMAFRYPEYENREDSGGASVNIDALIKILLFFDCLYTDIDVRSGAYLE